jgi:hypothetical protein
LLDLISGRIRFLGAFTVDLPTALLHDLVHLSSSAGLHDDVIAAPLSVTVAALRAAVPSYRGLYLTIVENGHPIQVATFLPQQDGESIATSLRLPLAALAPGLHIDSQIVFYAATPGAFVDLAADLGYALTIPTTTDSRRATSPDLNGHPGTDHREGHRSIVLDGDLPPATLVSGVTGLDNLSAINRAVGILIDQGHPPNQAYATLRQDAATAGVAIHIYAGRLLRR